MKRQPSILIIYTGGTIGMIIDSETGVLYPFDFGNLYDRIPEIRKFDYNIESISFEPVIDSSDMEPEIWVKLANIIEEHYESYDGFVILHGSDTMAYTASALSFMLENLSKPVILTGSQLPIGMIRTDGKENLITAIEMAAARKKGKAAIPEVCIYFDCQLYRGNRTHKENAEHFKAFRSVNYPVLAHAGVEIKYNYGAVNKAADKKLRVLTGMDNNIAGIRLFPGIGQNYVKSVLNTPGIKGLVLETFGSGNAPTKQWFLEVVDDAIKKGLIILNVTQCRKGSVEMGRYETSIKLQKTGVLSGYDITFEAAVTKMMYLFGNNYSKEEIKKYLQIPLRGEMTV